MDLSPYGEALSEYSGRGDLVGSDGVRYPATFVARQTRSGRIFLAVDIEHGAPVPMFLDASGFAGSTLEGWPVAATGLFQTDDLGSDEGRDLWDMRHVYRANKLRVEMAPGEDAKELRVGLTNFDFRGPAANRSVPTGEERIDLDISYGGSHVSLGLLSVPRVAAVMQTIRTTRSINVSAEISLRIDEISALSDPDSLLSAVATLLSVARGTKVQWVRKRWVDRNEKELAVEHWARITKPFAPLPTLDPGRPDDLELFLIQTLPGYEERRDRFRLERGTIDAYLDAKLEQDFLETRAVKLAIALEALKATILKDEAEAFHLTSQEFDGLVDLISEAIRETLTAAGIANGTVKLMSSRTRLAGLNRKSFRSLITRVAKTIGLRFAPKEVELFVACRNSLVHTGQFYCKSGGDEQFDAVAPLDSPFGEYVFMIHFLDRLILSLVGYTGEYSDRRTPGDRRRISLDTPLI